MGAKALEDQVPDIKEFRLHQIQAGLKKGGLGEAIWGETRSPCTC